MFLKISKPGVKICLNYLAMGPYWYYIVFLVLTCKISSKAFERAIEINSQD
jgi:hypothetical protein